MKRLLDNPLFLLLATGLLLGLYFPLGKQAGALGLNPIAWSTAISLFPGLVLFAIDRPPLRGGIILFGLVSGLFGFVIPNSLSFAAIPHVGSGYMALMFALSSPMTALASMALKVRPPNRNLLTGVALGFAGAILIVFSRNSVGASGHWPLLALLVPASLACGNVYRTAFWPKDISPTQLGAISNLGAVPAFVLLLALVPGGASPLAAPLLTLTQLAISLTMFSVFFRLQWVGGPTYLSQIGYVAAAVGLAIGSLILGEAYPWPVWAGAALIALGVAVSNR